MKFSSYLRDKMLYFALLIFSVVTSEILLIPFEIHVLVRLYIGICQVIVFLIAFFAEYAKKNSYFKNLLSKLEDLDYKYLISEVIEKASFVEGEILKDVMQEAGKSMLENVNKYKYAQEEYKEYIELWIHEIKLPISAGKLVIENNKTEVTESINEEFDKIEDFVEQALFYARSQAPEKDYLIKKQKLKEIVNVAVLKNKRSLIQNNIKVDVHDVENNVYTDCKWCVFIMNQIIQNAVKYGKRDAGEIEIYSSTQKEKTILFIKDNGIGIRKGEITRVFEKGFTGENGRKNGQKATGIGLYLCKKLCDKLGLGIELNSKENVGTEVKIVFPKSSFIEETIA